MPRYVPGVPRYLSGLAAAAALSTVTVAVAPLAAAAPAAASAPAAAAAAGPLAARARSLTLIDGQQISLRPGPGGRLSVAALAPADDELLRAGPAHVLRAGRRDPRGGGAVLRPRPGPQPVPGPLAAAGGARRAAAGPAGLGRVPASRPARGDDHPGRARHRGRLPDRGRRPGLRRGAGSAGRRGPRPGQLRHRRPVRARPVGHAGRLPCAAQGPAPAAVRAAHADRAGHRPGGPPGRRGHRARLQRR